MALKEYYVALILNYSDVKVRPIVLLGSVLQNPIKVAEYSFQHLYLDGSL